LLRKLSVNPVNAIGYPWSL